MNFFVLGNNVGSNLESFTQNKIFYILFFYRVLLDHLANLLLLISKFLKCAFLFSTSSVFQEEKLACQYLRILQGGLRFNVTLKVCTFIVKVVAIMCFIVTAERKSRVLCCLSYQVSEASFFPFSWNYLPSEFN